MDKPSNMRVFQDGSTAYLIHQPEGRTPMEKTINIVRVFQGGSSVFLTRVRGDSAMNELVDYLTRNDDEIAEIMAKPYGAVTVSERLLVDRCATDMIRSIHKISAFVAVHNDEGILTIATMED